MNKSETKIAFVFGPWSSGVKTFDFTDLLGSSQGLTGSEIGCFYIAREMAKRGWSATIYAPLRDTPPNFKWENVTVRPLASFESEVEQYQVVYVWNEPDLLRTVPSSALRIENHQIADFNFCKPGWDEFVDVFTSPSDSHLKWMSAQTPCPEKWRMVPNGWEPEMFPSVEKVSGRVIYASSPDRGLHWLLQQWPKIRKEVPHATLRIFYNFDSWAEGIGAVRAANPGVIVFKELHFRALYIKEAIRRLADHGVEHCKAVSRAQMSREFGEAACIGYPCDPVKYTETFCVVALEGCATGAIPVMTDVDVLGDIFGSHAPMVQAPVHERLDEFTDMVVRALSDESFQSEWRQKGREFADGMTWENSAVHLERVIEEFLPTNS
jgi:glycosyltransferase involved in cell wall biosynthesis